MEEKNLKALDSYANKKWLNETLSQIQANTELADRPSWYADLFDIRNLPMSITGIPEVEVCNA